MRKPPQGDWRSVDRGTRRPGIELRNQVVWDADAVKALACGRHLGKALSWPYVGPRVLSSYFATYVNAVACISRPRGQRLHIRLVVVRWHGEPHGRTGAQVVGLVFPADLRAGLKKDPNVAEGQLRPFTKMNPAG